MSVDNVTYGDTSTVTGGLLSEIREDQQAGALKGAQLLAKCLREEGVELLFGYPGGANLEIFDVLRQYDIRCIRVEHEQGAVHAAQGYARATGRVGVCLATSGPGATNLVTGIADANSDSTPIVAITGNVPSGLLGKNAFQEVDIVGITQPITKRSYLVDRVRRIPEVVREAFALAGGNRPGPVLIDIPKDIQQHYPRDPEGNYRPPRIPAVIEAPETVVAGLTDTQLQECVRLIAEARRPVIYAGGGIVSAGVETALLALAEKLDCPVTNTLMGIGCFPPDHELALHVLGMHGSKYANTAINEADLVLALGVRFDDRVTGKVSEFIKHGKIIHIDVDRDELNKNKTVTLPICADLAVALEQLVQAVNPGDFAEWRRYLDQLQQSYPFSYSGGTGLRPQFAIETLSDMTAGEAVVSLGVGQHQMWAMQYYRACRTRSFLSSSGFGTMGYGLPAAMGAKMGCPQRQVIDIDGDGSLNMTIHELSTCHRYGIGVKVVVINNQWLGMVRQWQDMIYEGHRAHSALSAPDPAPRAAVYPDFVTIAAGYGVKAERVTETGELVAAFERMLADPDEPYLVDIVVEREENVFPMIPAGATYKDIIMSAEDLARVGKDEQGANI
ncbi:biosynthetic-type acetolactate synthase large subunit [Exilibacterium tricleocarpae]|uniref:Acetolactate synthase n=1 Tax=Exilibacterium tricleocarpae TaxID=2591008 RepID=A0A545SYZ9_9GAMM|nr:biosynthetic-type acetolactate synthase large subunit [Exilibacterium tricleocarpae]TQV70171.1 biosynthetic-type acetolactate synthase large subunit [Exilibacterium tricleocarpae]